MASELVSVFSNFKNFLIFQLIFIKLASKFQKKYLTAGEKKFLHYLPLWHKSWTLVNQPRKMFTGSYVPFYIYLTPKLPVTLSWIIQNQQNTDKYHLNHG